jgi:hypothetical protein
MITSKFSRMEMTEAPTTYYYNVEGGVTPADHDIEYYHTFESWGSIDGDGTEIFHADLEINNPKPFSTYLENIEGHYVKGVTSWQEAHTYLIDLTRAMLEEIIRLSKTDIFNATTFNDREYKVHINEKYAGGTEIDYYCYFCHCPGDKKPAFSISIYTSDEIVKPYIMNKEALSRL